MAEDEKNILLLREKALSNRRAVVDIQDRIEFIRQRRLEASQEAMLNDLEIESLQHENESSRKELHSQNRNIHTLLAAIESNVIDNDQTKIGSEPAYVSIWSSKERETIKNILLEKLKKL